MVINVVGNLVSLMGPNKTNFNSSLQISKNVFDEGKEKLTSLKSSSLDRVPICRA